MVVVVLVDNRRVRGVGEAREERHIERDAALAHELFAYPEAVGACG